MKNTHEMQTQGYPRALKFKFVETAENEPKFVALVVGI